MDSTLLIIYALTSFIIAFLVFPVLIKLLHRLQMFDGPGEHKIHQSFTPSLGGAAIVIGVAFSVLVALPLAELSQWKIFFISLTLMFITGLRDDILSLSPLQKLLSQLLPVCILVVFGNVQISSFYELHQGQFPIALAWIVSIFTITILTNAYNLIDGLDGLAGSIAVLTLAVFGSWFWGTGNHTLALLSITFFGGTMAFLVFNWQPAKIFMGDTGALTLGLLLAFLALQFINLNYQLDSGHAFHFRSSISTAVGVLIIPIFDTFRVILIRLSRAQSPFRADRNHLHHKLIALGFSHAQSVLVLVAFNAIIILLIFILRSQTDQVILPATASICFIAHLTLKAYQKKFNGKQGAPS